MLGEEALGGDWSVMASPDRSEEQRGGTGIRGFLESSKAHFYNLYQRSVPSPAALRISPTADMWLLGTRYPPTPERTEQVVAHLSSRLWFTYRRGVAGLEGAPLLSSDMGWGCMVRTAQMMLGQALSVLLLGREWRLTELADPSRKETKLSTFTYNQLLRYFADGGGLASPYSLQAFVRVAVRKFGYKAGDFFGPTLLCRVVRLLVRGHALDGLTMHVPMDGLLHLSRVEALCLSSVHSLVSPVASVSAAPGVRPWRPVLIWVPLRLGMSRINPLYIPALRASLQWPQSLGFIGGKPNASFYFIGSQDDRVFYLDPHWVQPMMRPESDSAWTSFSTPVPGANTCQCAGAKDMAWEDLDPSLALGFLCRTRDELLDLATRVRVQNAAGDGQAVLFGVANGAGDAPLSDDEEEPTEGAV